MSDLVVVLRDRNQELCDAWTRQFEGQPDVEISSGDIFDGVDADAIVSPANSFGFMDGGIDQVYANRFGAQLQEELQGRLAREFAGELPVGQALMVPTGDPQIPWLVSAPTMRVPEDVAQTVNAYLAFRAALQVVLDFNAGSDEPVLRLLCPGLATAIGKMPADRCARQMLAAYKAIVLGDRTAPASLLQAHEEHRKLLR